MSFIHDLLVTSRASCLTCSKIITRSVRGYPEICEECYCLIPWITKPRCHICGRHVGCPDCSRRDRLPRRFLMNRSAVAYSAVMKGWLAQYKFRGHEAYSPLLSRMMSAAMKKMTSELCLKNNDRKFQFHAIIPVPISEDRMLERGFNQARALAFGAGSAGRAPVLELLRRVQHTEKQSFKSRQERLDSLMGVYAPASNVIEQLLYVINKPTRRKFLFSDIDNRAARNSDLLRLLIIDDVYTTGSTIDACAAVLQEACKLIEVKPEIHSLTWARS
ncbi:DNA utilization protein GntX [compost metagenome]